MFDFRFDLPAVCAAGGGSGAAGIGVVVCAELEGVGLGCLPELGIACEGLVLRILLISKCPARQIRSLAVDSGSRTSVALARIVLERRYGCRPLISRHRPLLD